MSVTLFLVIFVPIGIALIAALFIIPHPFDPVGGIITDAISKVESIKAAHDRRT